MNKDLCDCMQGDHSICLEVKQLISLGNFQDAIKIICNFMAKYPNSAIPHNLLGIVYERRGNHILAMKHFRVAWCLEPTYLPARANLDNWSNFQPIHKFYYEDEDCLKNKKI